MSIKISVIIPVYNLEKYISKCLESVVNQTLRDIEIIIINDGSTDGTIECINKYSEVDSRIKIYTQKNQGVSTARNKGIELSKGEYITFIDGDDTVHTNMLEDLYIKSLENKTDMTICSLRLGEINYKDGEMYKLSNEEYVTKIIKEPEKRTSCGILFNRKRIIKYNIRFYEDMKYGEDMLFSLNYIKNNSTDITYINRSYYNVSEREGSATRRADIYRCATRYSMKSTI